ncbi:alginate lyase [Algibacter lectus]|uniref:Alginate lyase n=2 Tax=Algibacter lectus TaxID=221126 RepID=A0A090V9P0_9FLAO|nr:alginate lyase [Algibacter lectus]
MNLKTTKSTLLILSMVCLVVLTSSCRDTNKKTEKVNAKATVYPSDVVPFMDQWRILCGDGTKFEELANIEHRDYFYVTNDGNTDWVVYKTPNSGITSRTSSNTRTELGQKEHWTTEIGGKLTGSLKVMHVSTSGDARVAASYSVVVGQIHGNEGHENEPLKIFYKIPWPHQRFCVLEL